MASSSSSSSSSKSNFTTAEQELLVGLEKLNPLRETVIQQGGKIEDRKLFSIRDGCRVVQVVEDARQREGLVNPGGDDIAVLHLNPYSFQPCGFVPKKGSKGNVKGERCPNPASHRLVYQDHQLHLCPIHATKGVIKVRLKRWNKNFEFECLEMDTKEEAVPDHYTVLVDSFTIVNLLREVSAEEVLEAKIQKAMASGKLNKVIAYSQQLRVLRGEEQEDSDDSDIEMVEVTPKKSKKRKTPPTKETNKPKRITRQTKKTKKGKQEEEEDDEDEEEEDDEEDDNEEEEDDDKDE